MEREVMEAIYHAFQHWMLCACLAGLGMIAALLFLAKVAAPAWDAVRRWWSLPCIQRVIVAVCVVGLSYYGATKQGWHVAYDGGIKAGATANVVTNDTVSIHWQRDTSGGVYVPETAAVYIDYRPNTETNAEWGLLAQTTVGAWGWSGTVENATNYDYNVWAYYIPPEPVHTNGVWTYKTHFDRNGEYALPLRARVEVNGVAIATPAEKRKDAEKRPYDAEVEYLESTGPQWIDTGIISDGTGLTVEVTCSKTTSATQEMAIVGRSGHDGFELYVLNSKFELWNSSGIIAKNPTTISAGEVYDVIGSTTGNAVNLSVNGVNSSRSTVASFRNESIVLFRHNSKYYWVGRLMFCKIYQNGTLVRDYIPVRKGTVGYLYDRVSGELFGNKGTGNFGYGNDK